ncbi:MAG TPA: tyrosine-type recombinase/integrase [Bryobacteraceae bacterium]|nr:tyrosine-type recombinase/integrase [Bryobacteraceae bacterium]
MYFEFTHRVGIKVRFHDLRHSHASQLLRAGVSPKVVQERLGHGTVGITLDIYSHILPGIQEEAVRKLDLALRAAIANQHASQLV